jgi:hypothetical protein
MHLALVAAVASLLFPLTPGTHWTLRDIASGARTTISVGKGRVLHGFPGAGDVRVRNAGKTVQAWDAKDGRWEPWFRFGAKKGERYMVRLASTLLWQSVEVRVASKTASARDYHGKTYRGCTRFVFQVRGLADAGVTGMTFCPHVGPVRFSETTIAGPRTFALASVA